MHLPEDPTHPIQVAVRTYALALSFALGPSLAASFVSLITEKHVSSARLASLKRVLGRELRLDGFASTITLAIGGGAALQCLWRNVARGSTKSSDVEKPPPPRLCGKQKAFISNLLPCAVGFTLLRSGKQRWRQYNPKKRSPTLDLTILLFVRAMDVLLQYAISPSRGPDPGQQASQNYHLKKSYLLSDKTGSENRMERRRYLASRIDAFIFWACSARIMWCFFYEPQRLPPTYVKWIGSFANLDGRLLHALNRIRDGSWSYLRGSPQHRGLLMSYAQDLGRPKEWGDPLLLPPYGGNAANASWQVLGVESRTNVGGLPCEIVHGNIGPGSSSSCTFNALRRGVTTFVKAMALYIPAHFLPVLLMRPKHLLRPHRFVVTLIATLRSATFLSTFVASYWYAVCLTRTLVLARVLPWISHDFWDGPYGCSLVGSFICGNSIWIEDGRRRGEMALYVLPRALRTCLPRSWARQNNRVGTLIERAVFAISLSTLLTAATHRPDTLRGLSRWTLAFIVNGPNAGFWKRKRQSPSVPPTPTFPTKSNVKRPDTD